MSVNLKNVDGKFIADVRFGRVAGMVPNDRASYEGTYAEALLWLAGQQLSAYPITCVSLSRVIAETSEGELRGALVRNRDVVVTGRRTR